MSSPQPRLSRSESLHQQVARNLRNEIEAGVLRDGEVLPSTRELAERWDVSVFTISEAMKILADEGLVISKSRSKRIVHAPNQARGGDIRLRTPWVVMIGGYAGSGKTELGRVLARETGWPMLDKDTITRPVVEAALELLGLSPYDRESDAYATKVRPREYESLIAVAHENVACGNSSIVTAPFIREFTDTAWVDRIQASHTAMNAQTLFVWVYCDADTMHTYIRHRGAARDAAKLANWPAYLDTVDFDMRPTAPHTVIDNCASSAPLQKQAKDLLASILSAPAATA
ncbi:GntR family transcriptional regulator [Solwaraspora sp. WMMD406]|uniref:GntR family transcriptional regulator n=1 Tax=Solwaraspora sp. WMMD406 TaxID=3016095 RepID=UPI00241598CD|nr:GntR family transcriptional regulator [Solwaraspora sp. WMMD406]MDG4768568.1 GntR family transcriptional regulator [Solwaraspora sp. WMMD406]